jgi:hypothetical protein
MTRMLNWLNKTGPDKRRMGSLVHPLEKIDPKFRLVWYGPWVDQPHSVDERHPGEVVCG